MPPSDRPPATLVVVAPTTSSLARPQGQDPAGPALLYIASLGTDRSRQTALESFRRIARALGAGDDSEAWRRIPWGQLGAAQTTHVRVWLLENVGPSTARLTLAMLRGVLKQAWRLGLMTGEEYMRARDTAPIRATAAPAGRMLAPEEIAKIRDYCAKLVGGEQRWAIFACALGGGLRREELVNLRADALADDERHLRFIGKGRKEAVQALTKWAGEAIRDWLALRDMLGITCERMFVERTRKGQWAPFNVWGIWALITKTGRDAGVAHFTPHDLRRTFGSTLIDTTDIAKAQKMMRHRQAATTIGYDRRTMREAEQALDALESWGGTSKAPEQPMEATSIDASAMPPETIANPHGEGRLVKRSRKPPNQ